MQGKARQATPYLFSVCFKLKGISHSFYIFLADGHDQSVQMKSNGTLIFASWVSHPHTFAQIVSFSEMLFQSFLCQASLNVSSFT